MKKIHFIAFLILSLFLFSAENSYRAFAEDKANVSMIDRNEYRILRQWQNIDSRAWKEWTVSYLTNIINTHKNLYRKEQSRLKKNYFKSGEIKYNPLIVWFVYENGFSSYPKVIKSSGSKNYDVFYCNVIKKAPIPELPKSTKRIFFYEGELNELVDYLKSKQVLPYNYEVNKSISFSQLSWNNL